MRKLASILLLGLLVLALPACSDDDDPIDGDGTVDVEVHYDGPKVSSPTLPSATYEAAARFTAVQTAAVTGGTLTEVRFYINTVPTSARVKVYGAGNNVTPGTELYSANLTGLQGASWNTHVLQNTVVVPNGDLWLSVEFTHPLPQATIGCDQGPAVVNGDWLYSSADSTWIPLNTRFPAIDINWNIRGIVKIAA